MFSSSSSAASLLNTVSDIFSDHFYNLESVKIKKETKRETSSAFLFNEYFCREIKNKSRTEPLGSLLVSSLLVTGCRGFREGVGREGSGAVGPRGAKWDRPAGGGAPPQK